MVRPRRLRACEERLAEIERRLASIEEIDDYFDWHTAIYVYLRLDALQAHITHLESRLNGLWATTYQRITHHERALRSLTRSLQGVHFRLGIMPLDGFDTHHQPQDEVAEP